MNDIDTSLIPDFAAEAVEHLEEMESGLLKIEANPNDTDILNGIFRNIHTIKGAAQFIGLKQTATLSHSAENLLDLLRSAERPCTSGMIDVLIQVKDRLGHLLHEIENTESEQTLVDDLVAEILVQIEGPNTNTKASTDTKELEIVAETEIPIKTSHTSTETTAKVASVTDTTSYESENYQEELDQELFTIFLHQLSEEITTLNNLLVQAKATDIPGPILLDCIGCIDKLKSSANYMGYEHLINLYDAWVQDLYKCLETTPPNWQILDNYFTKIKQHFPQLDIAALTTVSKEQVPTAEVPKTKVPDTKISEVSTPPQQVTIPESIAAVTPKIAIPKVATSTAARATETTEDKVALSTQLRSALQELISQDQTTPSENTDVDDVFEELTEIVPDDNDSVIQAKTEAAMAKDMAQDEIAATDPQPDKAPLKSETRPESPKTSSAERILKRSVRVDAEKIDTLMNQVGELIVHRSYFNQIQNELIKIQRRLDELGVDPQQVKALRTLSYRYSEAIVSLSRTANELQEGVMKVRMLPIAQLFNRYPRLVHDLVRHSEKQVQLEMRGEETELDKMIIEEVSDPLIHIIRNAVDHGFETTSERVSKRKPEIGTLLLEAYHESNHIVIKITDNGRGIDVNKVGAKALKKGLVTKAELEHMTPREIMRLTMAPGFSTADTVTSTSGRGVGMDVVRKNIEKLNGTVEIDSELGKGTSFRLKIPLTLAIISALQVRVGDNNFTVPLANVEETLRVFENETSVIEGIEVVQLRGHTMPIFRLASIFNIENNSTPHNNNQRFFVVVVNTGNEKIGLVVDELLGQDEVVIKPLIDFLQEQSGFSGATIIGGGRISLILDVYELVKMTALKQANMQHQIAMRRRQQMQQNRIKLK